MSLAATLADALARPLSSPIAGGGGPVVPSFDTDAADYFARVAALGGSFDQSTITATYTEAYVKAAINDFVVGCKADSVWSSITEMYLMAGVSFAGITAKLKYLSVPAVTNYNFVTGDYVAAGGGAGLKGDGSTKYMDTGIAPGAFATATSVSHGFYCTVSGNNTSYNGANLFPTRLVFSRPWGSELTSDAYDSSGGRVSVSRATVSGMIIGTRTATAHSIMENGVIVASNATSGGVLPATNYILFGVLVGDVTSGKSNGRDTFAFLGQGLSDADAIAFSSRVNALMTALGSNVY